MTADSVAQSFDVRTLLSDSWAIATEIAPGRATYTASSRGYIACTGD